MIIEIYACKICGTGVYSRCLGDTRECRCGNIHIIRTELNRDHLSVTEPDSVEQITLNLKRIDRDVLQRDFDEMADRYGFIKKVDSFAKHVDLVGRVPYRPRRYFEDDQQNMNSLFEDGLQDVDPVLLLESQN